MDLGLQDKVAVVTGAGKGIGRGIALRLARDGFAIASLDLDAEAAEAVAAEIRDGDGEAIAVAVDVSSRGDVEAAMQRVRAELGPILVLVNNAGITGFREFLKIDEEKLDQLMKINFNGTFVCTQVALPDMIEAGWGRVVNISSSSAQTGAPYMTHYAATKGAVIAFTKSLAAEVGPAGITVNTIPPGSIDTPMSRESERRGMFGGSFDDLAGMIPVRRVGTADDIAAACSYLVSDDAGYVTGQIIGVNGGRVTG